MHAVNQSRQNTILFYLLPVSTVISLERKSEIHTFVDSSKHYAANGQAI